MEMKIGLHLRQRRVPIDPQHDVEVHSRLLLVHDLRVECLEAEARVGDHTMRLRPYETVRIEPGEVHAIRELVTKTLGEIELNGIIGSIAHIAYHLGAIRQIDRAARGPSA